MTEKKVNLNYLKMQIFISAFDVFILKFKDLFIKEDIYGCRSHLCMSYHTVKFVKIIFFQR